MRQAGNLPREQDAKRFADYLLTCGIEAHAEQDDGAWAIWIRDENHLDDARAKLAEFRDNPQGEQFQQAAQEAERIRREEHQRRKQQARNVVEMRGHWQRGVVRRAPAVFVLMALSVVVFLGTGFGRPASVSSLIFYGLRHVQDPQFDGDPLVDVRAGQLWRLITPIFVHFGTFHLVFNMYWLYYFGTQIESRKGLGVFLAIVAAIGVISNVAQAYHTGTMFGGMSGVNYGLFGYVWMSTIYRPRDGLFVSQSTIFILIVWFFLCMSPYSFVGNVANMAHGVGLAVGIALGYAPELFRST